LNVSYSNYLAILDFQNLRSPARGLAAILASNTGVGPAIVKTGARPEVLSMKMKRVDVDQVARGLVVFGIGTITVVAVWTMFGAMRSWF
jgi:hypothetical protein